MLAAADQSHATGYSSGQSCSSWLSRSSAHSRAVGSRATLDEGAGCRSIGIALQLVGFATAGFGSVHVALTLVVSSSIVSTVIVALLGGGGVAIFIASASAMGKNWSIVARTRSDHQLVRTGPFAIVRHPIYLALLMYLLSMAVALGHYAQLLFAVPFYCAGAIIRIRKKRSCCGRSLARSMRAMCAKSPPSFHSLAEASAQAASPVLSFFA